MSTNKYVNGDMDSGLGSDEDRRGRTKEQKQLHNQQLLSGCFIDAASLSDEPIEIGESSVNEEQRRNEERRQGALIFQSSIPNYSMLQMEASDSALSDHYCSSGNVSSHNNFPETSTPYNSIVQLEEPEASSRKSPLGFYVDLSDVPDPTPSASAPSSVKKNIFSMVIDFEAPKKDKPTKLSSSYGGAFKKGRIRSLSAKSNGSLSSSLSSINSTTRESIAGTSRQSDTEKEVEKETKVNLEVLSASLIQNLPASSSKSSSSSSSSSDNNKNVEFACPDSEKEQDNGKEPVIDDEFKENVMAGSVKFRKQSSSSSVKSCSKEKDSTANNADVKTSGPVFVKLADLECQKPRIELDFTPRMSRSIPESHWVESPLLMSRSAGYRSAPHPMEPEQTSEVSSDSEHSGKHKSQPRKSVQRLGTDLLRMFLEEIGPDVIVEVEGHKFKAHKCILQSRCQYFAAMLSGNGLDTIPLEGFSYEAVYFALCHIYSGAAHVPDSISLVELASLADMLSLEGLKEVVEHALKQRHCHNFHKPCAGCCTGVLEVLPLSAAYGLDDLYQKCLQWITLHFVRVWPSRAFASLPRELREKCYQQHVVHMTPDRVLDTILACDKVLATLPALRWAEPVSQLVLQLSDACHLYHRQHFAAVLNAHSFLALDTGLGWNVCQVEDQIVSAARNLGVEQACRSYTRCCKMLEKNWSRPFSDLLNKIKVQLEQCLVSQADRLIRSNAWLRLDTALRTRIKELTPQIEPASRLPRATPRKINKTKTSIQSPSSSDSSRNSSPAMSQQRTSGSPSLRRSLLLAAKTPQVPPSPSTNRRSTLTQPTAASAARSAATPSRNIKSATKPVNGTPMKSKSAPVVNHVNGVSKSNSKINIPSQKATPIKKQPIKNQKPEMKRPDSRSSSPMKSDSRLSSPRKIDSRVTSPIKAYIESKPNSPRKDSKPSSPRKVRVASSTVQSASAKATPPQPEPPKTPLMQRSGTFLKDEPTVLGKIFN